MKKSKSRTFFKQLPTTGGIAANDNDKINQFSKGNIHQIRAYTLTLTEFLRKYPGRYSHYILLDHQDWMAGNAPEALEEKWTLILQNSQSGTVAGHDLGAAL